MILTCSICNRKFFYLPLPQKVPRNFPSICGYRANNGKWISNDICKRKRNMLNQKKYVKIRTQKRRERRKEYWHEPGKTSRVYTKRQNYNIKTKRICKWPGCKEYTGNNGQDYFYCWYHKQLLEYGCSQQYENCIYASSDPDWEYLEEMYGDEVRSLEMEG